jgi:hypothetical protein
MQRTPPPNAAGRINTPNVLKSIARSFGTMGLKRLQKTGTDIVKNEIAQTETYKNISTWAQNKWADLTGQYSAGQAATHGIEKGGSAYGGWYGGSEGTQGYAQQGGGYQTGQTNAGYGGGEGGARGTTGTGSQGSTMGSKIGFGLQLAGAAYSGYKAAPMGAAFERQYMGSYSPGYLGAGGTAPIFQMTGGRNDREARQARGERIGMTGMGAIAGAMGGGGWGAVAGAGGAQFQENPYSGKRGYQEEWKYSIKPAGKSAWRDIESHNRFRPMSKGGTMRSTTNMENWKDTAKYSIPGMGGLGGGGKKPPSRSKIKKQINTAMGASVMRDYDIQEWWDAVMTDRSLHTARDYIAKAGDEGAVFGEDRGLPGWVTGQQSKGIWRDPATGRRVEMKEGEYNKGGWESYTEVLRKPQQLFGQRYVDGKKVAQKSNVSELARMQQMVEDKGRKGFYEDFMKNYDYWAAGGAPLQKKWHGNELYNIPSEVAGHQGKFDWINYEGDHSELDWWKSNQAEYAAAEANTMEEEEGGV